MGSEKQYTDLYAACRTDICRGCPDVMNAARDNAADNFHMSGFPTRKTERYKYTDVPKLFAPDYGLNIRRLDIPVDPYEAFKCDVPNLSTSLFFVVNDTLCQRLVPHASLPDGVRIGALRDLPSKNAHSIGTAHNNKTTQFPDFIADYYGRLARTDEDGVTALNTMLAQDGLVVFIPDGVKVERPIQVINILRSDVDMMVNRRVLIIVGRGAAAQLLFCDHAADDRPFLTTQVVEAYVADNAALELYCLEETHAKSVKINNVYIEQSAGSHVTHNTVTLHNGITRNRVDVIMTGAGAQCQLDGCVTADKTQHVDTNTLIEHSVPHCTSTQLYKYMLSGDAVGAFAGRVLVRKGAQQSVSDMRCNALCASNDARMYSQPMLEIYADDVKCSHGAATGQLNDAALFYMRQRGIALDEAKTLLEAAFINEVIDDITLIPLRDRLHLLVEKRLRGELANCKGCKLCR